MMLDSRITISKPQRLASFLLTVSFGAVLVFWNSWVGMSWDGPSATRVITYVLPLLAIGLYFRLRGDLVFSEMCFFLFLYLVFPMLGVRLSYLAPTLGLPFQDAAFLQADRLLGFDWAHWTAFIDGHAWFKRIVLLAYLTPLCQAIVSLVVFAIYRTETRNDEMLLTLVLSLTLVIATCAMLPTLGPREHLHLQDSVSWTILQIRSGHVDNLPYMGLVCFPSYHTVMAVVFSYSHRGLKTFLPFCILNALMLLGTPDFGDHYLSDMIGGAVIAVVVILAVRHLWPVSVAGGLRIVAPAEDGMAVA